MFLPMFLLFLSSLLLSQEHKVEVAATRAYIYAEPVINSSIIETVEKGTILTLLSKEKIRYVWYRVSFYSKKRSYKLLGFIQASLVEILGEAPKITKEERPKPIIKEKKPTVIPSSPPKIKEKKPTATAISRKKTYVPKKIKIGPKSGIEFLAGYAMPSEDNYNSGLKYGGNICLGITKNVSIELSGLSFQTSVAGDPEALSKGKLSVIPIQLSIQTRFPISSRFVPYLLGGGGYYLNRFTLDKEITDAWNALGFDIEEKVENAIGYHLGGGIDLFFTKNIALNVDIRYCIAKIKGSWTLIDQIIGTETSGNLEDLNLNSLMFGGGLKFCF